MWLCAIALMTEAVSTCETSISFCKTTLRNIPAGCLFHTGRRKKVKFQEEESLCYVISSSTFWELKNSEQFLTSENVHNCTTTSRDLGKAQG